MKVWTKHSVAQYESEHTTRHNVQLLNPELRNYQHRATACCLRPTSEFNPTAVHVQYVETRGIGEFFYAYFYYQNEHNTVVTQSLTHSLHGAGSFLRS